MQFEQPGAPRQRNSYERLDCVHPRLLAKARDVDEQLVSAGLPADQISSVTSKLVVAARVPVDADAGVKDGLLENAVNKGWFSILDRSYVGVPIVDSFAWAILDSTGTAVEEQVYWPEIGADVATLLRKFQTLLGDPRSEANFIASLPSDVGSGKLVIHHTSWDWQGTFDAQPCYRATFGASTLCYDISGSPIQLPDEMSTGS